MPIEQRKNKVFFKDVVGVEDAETLLTWLQKKPTLGMDFSHCTHLHPANLQVILAAKAKVLNWPANPQLRGLMASILVLHGQ